MATDSLTQLLAVWGAVTGTIGTLAGVAGLLLRVKQHKKDQPKLVCSSDFSFEHSSGSARPRHKLILRSVGKRPVTIDFVRYCLRPKSFWQNFFKKRMWRKKRWVWDEKQKNKMQLTEGIKEEIEVYLPSDVTILDVVNVEVYDQTGRVWKVEWPRSRMLHRKARFDELFEDEESNDDKYIKIKGYAAGEEFHIYVQWSPKNKDKNTFKGKYFHFISERKYEIKLKDILKIQKPKILLCEIDEVT